MKTRKVSHLNILTIALVILGALSMLLISGCTQQTPEVVVEKFFGHLFDGDSGSAMKYCTDRAMDQSLDNGDNAFNEVRDEIATGDNIFTESKLISDVRGNTSEVWSRDDEDTRIILINRNGVWRIDEFQLSSGGGRDRGRDEDAGEDEDEDADEDQDRRRLRDDNND